MEILVKKDGREQGPFSMDQVQSMVNAGQLQKTDLAFHEGLSNWLPVAAVLAPRATPPPYRPKARTLPPPPGVTQPQQSQQHAEQPPKQKAQPNPFDLEKRAETTERTLAAGANVFYKSFTETVFPFREIIGDKPWNLVWVRLVLLFALGPCLIGFLRNAAYIEEKQANFLLGVYAAIAWGISLKMIIRPSGLRTALVAKTLVLPFFALLAVLVLVGKVNFLGQVWGATDSLFYGKLIGSNLLVALVHQAVIGSAFLFLCVKPNRIESPLQIIFLACLAGLSAGLAPAAIECFGKIWPWVSSGVSKGRFDDASVIQVVSWPIMHALWLGVMGYSIVISEKSSDKSKVIIVGGFILAALLNALFVAAHFSWIGLLVAALTIILFATHLRLLRAAGLNAGIPNA